MNTKKLPYEPPTIARNTAGLMNKVGHRGSLASKTQIDGVEVERLINDFGSPLFVFSEAALQRSIGEARSAIARRNSASVFAGPLKTISLPGTPRRRAFSYSMPETTSASEPAL